eukprot:292363-Karenia_brevis.AAC.1
MRQNSPIPHCHSLGLQWSGVHASLRDCLVEDILVQVLLGRHGYTSAHLCKPATYNYLVRAI